MVSRRLRLDPVPRGARPGPRAPAPDPAAAPDAPDATDESPRLRLVEQRLPKPVRRTRRRLDVVYRPATTADAPACVALDGTYATSHIWQLDTRREGDEIRVAFRQVRLPRELTLIADHRPPVMRGGSARPDLFWMVAEEVEVDANAAGGRSPSASATRRPAERDAEPTDPPPGRMPWSDVVRPTSGPSAVQLSLPASG
jgi:hypothetical protein